MSEENVDADLTPREQEIIDSVRRTYDAFNRGDYDSAIELADPDIEVVTTGGFTNLRGVDQFRAWMEPETIENVSVEPGHFEIAGNNVLVHQLSRGRGVRSEIDIEMMFWAVWTFNEDGLATRFVMFHEEARAREAAGLSA